MTATMPVIHPVPINEAEAIVDSFFDEKISARDQYTLNSAAVASLPAGCNPRSAQYWCWDMLKWDHAPIDRPIIVLERATNVNIEGYDTLMVRLAIPEHVALRVSAVIDGVGRLLIAGEPGHAGPHEYEAPISGRRLQGLTLELTSSRDQADEGWLYWIGVANAGRRAAMLARPSPFTARWEPWLLPPDATPTFAPRCGFFFGADDLPAIRRRAASPAYRSLMEQMRQRARTAMSFHKTPEQQVGDHVGLGEIWKIQTRTRDWDTYHFATEAPVIAFVGLIDEDADMLRFAARIAVASAHCRSWAPHFMQDFPGSTWDTRAFPEAHVGAGVALTLDWAGGWFTDAGEHLIRYALTHKMLGRVRGAFLQYDYMWDCNQTHLIALGRLLGLLVQAGATTPASRGHGRDSSAMAGLSPQTTRGWARAHADIAQFEQDLAEMIDRYVQADGSSNEGVGYWGATFRCTLTALAALARYHGKPLRELVAPKLDLMWNFLAPLLSTADEAGTFLPIADTSSNLLAWDVIGMAAACLQPAAWQNLLAACLNGGKTRMIANEFMFDGPMTVIYGPDNPGEASIDVPVFRRLDTAGMITSNRPWTSPASSGAAGRRDTVRLHLVGSMANAGHCHPDKGSFILEAFGEVFAGDRGVTPYVDPRCRTLAAEVAHNLAVPADCFQINPTPVAALWQGQGDEERLDAEIDTSGAWRAPVRVARRRIHSPQPGVIEITDEFELDEARPVSFYLQTPLPITAGGAQATVQGKRGVLFVDAGWAVSSQAGEYYCDFSYRPWNRLVMTSAPGRRHVLTTVLHFQLQGE